MTCDGYEATTGSTDEPARATLLTVSSWQLVEAGVGFFLVVVASAVITRPAYRRGRFLMGVASAAWVVGLLGVLDGLAR